ncbi:hypothetical protein BC939DRAFT_480768 [Gamsiella multidivaricata]|uniref:uncharacterized protein n=1 Tax=Gamsiella multidivaricata TaxID=101098 RepID=UPI002220069F|nr:uncharacterized protein BC939DRAFT_480768 [Gamsiella multidivaricata]KAI7817906.1 hypothetical protein BC939DRAFT_480768 [Gamsiella multidivaricata]
MSHTTGTSDKDVYSSLHIVSNMNLTDHTSSVSAETPKQWRLFSETGVRLTFGLSSPQERRRLTRMLASVLTALRSRATRVSMKGLSYIKSKRDNNDTCDYGEDCEDDEDDDDGGNYEEDDSSEEHEEDMEEDEQTDTYDVDNDAFAGRPMSPSPTLFTQREQTRATDDTPPGFQAGNCLRPSLVHLHSRGKAFRRGESMCSLRDRGYR